MQITEYTCAVELGNSCHQNDTDGCILLHIYAFIEHNKG